MNGYNIRYSFSKFLQSFKYFIKNLRKTPVRRRLYSLKAGAGQAKTNNCKRLPKVDYYKCLAACKNYRSAQDFLRGAEHF